MQYEHPNIKVEEPAPGHYAVSGIAHSSIFIEGEGHVVAPGNFYISPGVPDSLLEAILEDRRTKRDAEKKAPEVAPPAASEGVKPKAKRGRKPKAAKPDGGNDE